MKWFEGGIAEAIAESRKNKTLFVVSVQHPPESCDQKSIRMAQLWDTVDNNICTPALIGIRVFDGTESARQFAQIYPVPIVPASYIIDLKGKPLDVITISEKMDEDVFVQRLKMAMKVLNITDQATSSATVDECKQITCKAAVQLESKSCSAGNMKKAHELHEKKHVEDKTANGNEEQRKGTLSKLMAKAKTSREERERYEVVEQRKREKREQEAYLKRVREQIKADKEERMNGFVRDQTNSDRNTEFEKQGTYAPSAISSSTECRIQCKFPDGSILVHHFASTDAFSELVELVKIQGRQGSDFHLVQMYPKREFSDFTKTFAELGLVPSATVLVISKRKRPVAIYGASRWVEFLQYAIVTPFQALYRVLLYLVGYGGISTSKTNDGTKSSTANGTRITKDTNERLRNRVRQEGNIRRFYNEEDSSNSDDEARWNGNSTQQL